MKLCANFLIILLSFSLISCSSDEQGPTTGNEQSDPVIEFVPGKVLRTEASEDSFLISSDIVKNEIDEVIPDGIVFVVSSEEGVMLSNDDSNFSSSIEVKSLDGVFSFYAKAPTAVELYRVEAKPKDYNAIGRFFIQVDPAEMADIGTIKSSRFEDLNQNGIKDPGEIYSFLADGQATGFVIVGPISDEFGNTLDEGRVQITIDKGSIISENPASLSDGFAYIRVESDDIPGTSNIEAWAIDGTDQEISGTRIQAQIEFVAPQLTIAESGDFDFVFLGDRKEIQLTLRNSGTSRVSNMNYSITSPFVLEDRGACNNKNFLLPGEECILTVSFFADVNQLFFGDLQIVGSPSTAAGTTLTHDLQGFGAKAPEIRVENNSFDFGVIDCGSTQTVDLVVTNIGDFPAENLQVSNPPPHDGQTNAFFNLTIPPADPNPSPNPDAIIDCGTTLPGGRRCRIQVEFSPQALVSNQPLNAGVSIDGQNPIQITVRGASQPGPPQGTPPISFFDSLSGNPITGIDLSTVAEAEVRVGPIQDICGNEVSNGTNISGVVSSGTLVFDQVSTNSGLGSFLWRGSDEIDDIGPQTITVTGGAATNSAQLNFNGIKLELTGTTNVGQVLNVLPKTFTYNLANNGTVSAENLDIRSEILTGENPLIIDDLGECEDLKLLPGESCDIVVEVNTLEFLNIPSLFDTNLRVDTNGIGQISQTLTVSGNAEYPPVLVFSSTLYNLGSAVAGQGTPTARVTLLNDSSADAFDLDLLISEPFVISNSTCTDTLLSFQQCEFDVSLITTVSRTFNSNLRAVSEFTEEQTFATGFIAADKADGIIPMELDVPSVPANNIDEITITLGPIRDQFANIVATGTEVEVSSTIGRLSLDSDQDGIATINTDENGLAVISIRSKDFEEITTFTINSRVLDTDAITVLAQGSIDAQFTGVILSFDETSLDYGDVPVGNVELRTATLRNTGNEAASQLVLSSSNSDFIISDVGTCSGALSAGATLNPNESCTITIAFFPASNNTVSGFIQANSAGNGVLTDSVALSGQGILPAKLVASVEEIFAPLAPGESFSGSFTVENEGNEPVTNFLVEVLDNASDFSFNYTTCTNLAALGTCTVDYTYSPSGVSATQTTIRISADGGTRTTVDEILFTSQPAQIQFQIVPFTLAVDQCGEIKMQSLDFNNDPIIANTNLNLNLSATIGSFFSDNGCTNSISSITLPQGSSETSSFYFKSTGAGDSTISIDGSNLLVESTVQIFSPLTIIPEFNSNILVSNSSKDFTASGGVAPYSWQITSGLGLTSGGVSGDTLTFTVNNTSDSGSYSIQVTDNIGNIATLTGTKAPGVSATPLTASIDSEDTLTIVASGGSGNYTYTITTDGGIGSSVSPTGVFIAGENTTDFSIDEEVTVSDSFGSSSVVVQIEVKGNKYKFQKIDITTLSGGGRFGEIEVDEQHNLILVGNPEYNTARGRVLSYIHDGSIEANFTAAETILGTSNGQQLGTSISKLNNVVLVGSPYYSSGGGFPVANMGRVGAYIYNGNSNPGDIFGAVSNLDNPNLGASQLFGFSTSLLLTNGGTYKVAAGFGGNVSGRDGAFFGARRENVFGTFYNFQQELYVLSPSTTRKLGLEIDSFDIDASNQFFVVAGEGFFKTYQITYSSGAWPEVDNVDLGGSSDFSVSVDVSTSDTFLAVGDPDNNRVLIYEFNEGSKDWSQIDTITSTETGFGKKVGFADGLIAVCTIGEKAFVYKSSNGSTGWTQDLEIQESGKICDAIDISESLMAIGFDDAPGGDTSQYLYMYKINK